MDHKTDTVQIVVKPRHLSGSDVAKKIRRAGLLPAVIYGQGSVARAIAIDPKPVKRGLTSSWGRNQMFQLQIEGEDTTHYAIAKDVQVHPVTRVLQHVDLHLVNLDTPMEVTLPVTLTGRSAGQKAGGRLEFINRQVKVRCTPNTLPRLVDIDITSFENGTVMMIEQLPLPEGVTPVFKKSFKIFEIIAVKVEAVAVVEEKKGGKK